MLSKFKIKCLLRNSFILILLFLLLLDTHSCLLILLFLFRIRSIQLHKRAFVLQDFRNWQSLYHEQSCPVLIWDGSLLVLNNSSNQVLVLLCFAVLRDAAFRVKNSKRRGRLFGWGGVDLVCPFECIGGRSVQMDHWCSLQFLEVELFFCRSVFDLIVFKLWRIQNGFLLAIRTFRGAFLAFILFSNFLFFSLGVTLNVEHSSVGVVVGFWFWYLIKTWPLSFSHKWVKVLGLSSSFWDKSDN